MILGLPSQGCQRFGHLQTLPSSGVVPQDDAASGGTPFVSGKNIVIIQRFKEHRASILFQDALLRTRRAPAKAFDKRTVLGRTG